MKIAVISDSHDNLDNLRKAVEIINSSGAVHVFHAGDFTSPFTIRALKELKCPLTGVFGNNDGDRLLLSEKFNGRIYTQPYTTTFNGKKIVLMHEPVFIEALRDSGHFDIIIYGHTHEADIRQEKGVIIINPGELAGWLYGKPSFAIFDLETMKGEIINIS
ncbi:MAG: metallophosphoesterase [Thermodesulfovibrionales bacterium]|nr:metallophosphoesterase [Thermodesulfovibrionales bacterium]